MPQRDPNAPPAPDPVSLVADLSRAHIAARCLHVIAECGAADAVGDAGATPAEIAAQSGLDADALDRMLRLLAAHGIFVRMADGRYTHSAASRLLKTDEPGSLRSYVRMAGMPAFSPEVISDAELANIQAYLASQPRPPPLDRIPLLAP